MADEIEHGMRCSSDRLRLQAVVCTGFLLVSWLGPAAMWRVFAGARERCKSPAPLSGTHDCVVGYGVGVCICEQRTGKYTGTRLRSQQFWQLSAL